LSTEDTDKEAKRLRSYFGLRLRLI